MQKHVLKAVVTLFVVAMVSWQGASSARAQSEAEVLATAGPGERVGGHIAGAVGLGLLGAEVGLILVPTVGLHDQTWAWVVFPIIGAAGGAVAGVFALNDDGTRTSQAINLSLISAGMGLAVPTVVGSIALKRRRERLQFESARERGLFQFGRVKIDAPTASAEPVYSAREQARFGVSQRNAFRLSLLSGRF